MTVFDSIKRKVTETAIFAAKKSTDFVEITKLNLLIDSHEDETNEIFQNVGKAIYERYKNENGSFLEYSDLFEKVKSHGETVEQLKNNILDLKNLKVCKSCKAELEHEMQFCPNCGHKQEIKEEVLNDKKCDNCEYINKLENTYCHNCGTKF